VFGCFDGDRLVSAASACLWENAPVADLGVLTLPDVRGRGFARTVVLTISDFARREGYEPQYRCQLDNLTSVALAKSCGFALFGKWIVASDVLE
jgi:predicted GNAT family acetyltransferase